MKNFPFLEEIWKSYNFDKDLEESEVNQISSLCNEVIAYRGHNIENHKNVCKKLLRNLKLLHSECNNTDDFVKYCNNINNWLYYEIKQFKLVDSIINDIFDKSVEIVPKSSRKIDCSYFSFNEGLLETDSLARLRIFNNNSDNIKDILEKKCDSALCSCREFIHKFVNLYKSMNIKYCSDEKKNSPTYKGTCEIVNEFNKLYISFIYNMLGSKYEFPDLSSNMITYSIYGCQSDVTDTGSALPEQSKQSDRSIAQNASHALAAMAGIPPFLAIIYKFTPVRKFLLSKNKKGSREFNNLEQEIENELFHHKYGDTNASQMKFNVSYSPV
ncbi:unnamed protein product [Plasmodium vivax]|uniref:(malaria parasite P. vivax) hypothetical protein n=1 Tax=Plasmodium vivax TaxID=5855 RepID=A0A8S4H6C8_PLAVI|nr:unnamed protein product [Plasmodium vivax]